MLFRSDALRREFDRCLIIPISTPGVRERWAHLRSAIKRKGITIGDNDLWIAAAAHVQELTVLTTDGDFERLAKLQLVRAIVLDAKTGVRRL